MPPHALTGGPARRSWDLVVRGLRAEPRAFAVAIGASALYGVGVVASGWALGQVTDRVVAPALGGDGVEPSAIWWAGAALVLIGAVTAVAVAFRRVFAGIAALDVQAGHRRAVTRQYLRLPLSWHRRHPAGQLLSNASSDAEAAGMVFVPLPFALGVVVMIVVACAAMFAADPLLGLIGLTVLPLVLVVNAVYRRWMSPAITHAQEQRARVADAAHESFEAALLVKSLGTADREEETFARVTDRLRAANVGVGRIRSVFDPVIDFLPSAATLAVLVVGASQVASGAAGPGDVVTAAYLLTVMTFPVRAIGFVLGDLPRSLVGHDRISRVLDAPGGDEPPSGAGGAALDAPRAALEVRLDGVAVRVPPPPGGEDDVPLLHDVSLTLRAGRTLAVVGRTGSGKSTLVDVIAQLTPAAAGTVSFDGTDARDVPALQRTHEVAYVAQEAFVFEDTVRGNVLLDDGDPDGGDDDRVWEALRLARADEIVDALPDGLDTVIGERGTSLSGGQRQRIAIARALVRRPRLLLLDDATSALDPVVEREILAGLRSAGRDVTVVVVAYRPATIALADEVLHLERGRVVAHGTAAELRATDPGFVDLVTAYERHRAEVGR
ncbi:ABC transporter related [Beutenbergia cavernae DSM 12333]|uniref:ABC transporter related n=1 Tax=Beutenbergia cavernae (strain ATCC BAA-8 / DSM 12333 / CCUG 43141 / JCM 11478 / NBRC 16432 / NCIMB 13614 / HKI 0122) TaxID=471853 RepID=C5BV95_BEUC1|nr:ABC transporter ATP-binding protein [Beutenbergia cavernae]ACQ80482.1 ABC transporter related [Beutenbergia cavernae DSM 12333]